jgi:hypothetical protein
MCKRISAACHAAWNLLIKRDRFPVFWWALLAGCCRRAAGPDQPAPAWVGGGAGERAAAGALRGHPIRGLRARRPLAGLPDRPRRRARPGISGKDYDVVPNSPTYHRDGVLE